MSRAMQLFKTKLIIPAVVIVIAVVGGGIWWHQHHVAQAQTITNAHHQLTQISYHGQKGVNAFALLQRHASVQYKHYSFGNLVTAINGVKGNGPKYWTLYVNGKESSVGASAYVTKNGDTVTWKLQ